MSSDCTPGPCDEVSLEELAALRGGELTSEQETRLRARMAQDPQVEAKLWALDNVHRLFAKPAPASELPSEMPYDVAARLEARIAELALDPKDHAEDEDPSTSRPHDEHRDEQIAQDRASEDRDPSRPRNSDRPHHS